MKQAEEAPRWIPWSIFLYGMKTPMTSEKYRGRLAKIFGFIGRTEGTMEERAKSFAEWHKTTRLGISKHSELRKCSERELQMGR